MKCILAAVTELQKSSSVRAILMVCLVAGVPEKEITLQESQEVWLVFNNAKSCRCERVMCVHVP